MNYLDRNRREHEKCDFPVTVTHYCHVTIIGEPGNCTFHFSSVESELGDPHGDIVQLERRVAIDLNVPQRTSTRPHRPAGTAPGRLRLPRRGWLSSPGTFYLSLPASTTECSICGGPPGGQSQAPFDGAGIGFDGVGAPMAGLAWARRPALTFARRHSTTQWTEERPLAGRTAHPAASPRPFRTAAHPSSGYNDGEKVTRGHFAPVVASGAVGRYRFFCLPLPCPRPGWTATGSADGFAASLGTARRLLVGTGAPVGTARRLLVGTRASVGVGEPTADGSGSGETEGAGRPSTVDDPGGTAARCSSAPSTLLVTKIMEPQQTAASASPALCMTRRRRSSGSTRTAR